MTPNEIVGRLIAEASGRLMRGSDPRLTARNETGSTGATAEPAIQTSHPSTKGSSSNG